MSDHCQQQTPRLIKVPVKVSFICSPELDSIEQIHLCGFSSTHDVAHGNQCAGVELTRTLLGGV